MRQSLLPLLLSAAYLVTPIHAGHGLDRGHHHLELLHKRHVVTPSTTEAHDKRSVLDGILCVFGSGHSCEKQQAAEAVKSAQAAFSAGELLSFARARSAVRSIIIGTHEIMMGYSFGESHFKWRH